MTDAAPEVFNQQFIDRVDLRIEYRVQTDRIYPIFTLDGADVTITADNGITSTASVRGAAPATSPARRG